MQSFLEVAAAAAYFGAFKVSGILPCAVPGGFIEAVVSLIETTLIFQGKSEIVDRLAVVGVGVAFPEYLHCAGEIAFGFVETSLADVP